MTAPVPAYCSATNGPDFLALTNGRNEYNSEMNSQILMKIIGSKMLFLGKK
jgi:hypothetical protein